MGTSVTKFARSSRNTTNVAGFVFSTAIALIAVGGLLRGEPFEVDRVTTIPLVLFLLVAASAAAWFGYSLASPFEQRIEISGDRLFWKSERCPVTEGSVELKAVKSIEIHHDSEQFPSRIAIALLSGETVTVSFAWVLGRDSGAFVSALNARNQDLPVSVL